MNSQRSATLTTPDSMLSTSDTVSSEEMLVGSAAVFIHGIFSSQDVWQPLLTQLQQLPDVGERYAFPKFEYSSKKVVVNRMRRRPDLDALADWLRTFLEHQCREHDELVLVGHSQGGLSYSASLHACSTTGADTIYAAYALWSYWPAPTMVQTS